MDSKDKKIGIITYHASYNCGSMLQAYALQCFLEKKGYPVEVIDFATAEQKKLYSLFSENKSLKAVIRNLIFLMHKGRISSNFERYEAFKRTHFNLTPYSTEKMDEIIDDYFAVVAGADQIWNITIEDYDDAFFLPWTKSAKRIAYAPSFGAKNLTDYADDVEKYKEFLNDFDHLSIRENNGRKWIKDLIGKEVPVVLDPSMIVDLDDYSNITSDKLKLPEKYIFYYSPSYSLAINRTVRKISKKYGLPVIAFNTKSFYLRAMDVAGFKLPDFEDPTAYLQLMKNAEMVITTSFHGCIFSTLYRRKFWVVKNGGMFGNDDRVLTLMKALSIEDRLIPIAFDDSFDYMAEPDYSIYETKLKKLKKDSQDYLLSALEG